MPLDPRRSAREWSPWKYCSRGTPRMARYRYAEKAPGRTDTYPKLLSVGLSVISWWWVRCTPVSAQSLTKDVRHFVFKILSSNKGIQKLPATLYHGMNFTFKHFSASSCIIGQRTNHSNHLGLDRCRRPPRDNRLIYVPAWYPHQGERKSRAAEFKDIENRTRI